MTSSTLLTTALWCALFSGLAFLVARYFYRRKLNRLSEDLLSPADAAVVSSLQLQISKKELELVFDAIPEQICILDRKYTIIRANKSYADCVGAPVKHLPGKKCYHLYWKRKGRCDDCPVETTFEEGIAVIKRKVTRTFGDTVRHFEISSFPVVDERGRVIHAIEFTKDITNEKRMVEQLIRSEKLASIGNMTAGIAHEINNPLSGISGNAANLLKMPQKYGLNEKGISRVTTILHSAAHATAIMDDLLHLSHRPEQTGILVNINALIVKTANAVHINGSQEIERRFAIDEKMPPVNCDPSKIQQVIVHIVTNAMQAILDKKKSLPDDASYKGLMSISTQKKEDHALIIVADNGIGVDSEHRSKIFDPFFSTRPTGQGTGLGLSVSNKIVEEHGGKIFFESTDSMTQFSILLPFQREQEITSTFFQ
ncbi:MAG: PAS domain-containing protein [Chitinispirillaceae bacterium]|nr:PAS domain-containing protein [Chitinispirillaceae bacterium]